MKILLTGAGGQLGKEIACYEPFVMLHGLIALNRQQLDILHPDQIAAALKTHQPDVVINAAAYTQVDKAETEAELAHQVNAQGAENLAKACAQQNIPLIHFSTDYVFSGHQQTPYQENDLVAPLNIYGQSKLAGEIAIREICPKHLIIRVSWLYGIYGKNFVKTILRLARERTELKIVADQFGCPTTTVDVAAMLYQILPKLTQQESWGTYHFCSGTAAVNWFEFAQAIVKKATAFTQIAAQQIVPIATDQYPLPAKRPQYTVMSCEKISTTFGITTPQWSDSLTNFIRDCCYE